MFVRCKAFRRVGPTRHSEIVSTTVILTTVKATAPVPPFKHQTLTHNEMMHTRSHSPIK
ncbi:uncharacterized protein LOC119640393 isoform X2 [Glossina fuscipes]|uniref:Uncharacterized protein LOC119640393 isoform X2 n=1 Tax=Glossina fuscipes TaxID=7396 RepID=A0A9C6DWR0_9MUSC|nr:uncharacterized protein LOC119640393 isoform X2 [Glossina fuscipes]